MADRLEQRIEELERALKRERRLLAAERQRYESELAALRRQARRPAAVEQRDKEVARLERKLATIYSSRTWKAGRVVWRLFHLPRNVIGRRRRSDPAEAPSQQEVHRQTQRERTQQIPPVDYALVENLVVKDKYRAALARTVFPAATGGKNIVIAVSTTDLDEGRGDIFTAVGLGRRLEDLGYRVIYLPRNRWYELPRHTEVYLSLLETVDVTQLPEEVTTVAWVRNETDAWIEQPSLPLYDLVLSSSQLSLGRLEQVFPGPTGLLPIGVDTELFHVTGPVSGRRGVVSTVNQWGRERELYSHLQSIAIDFPLTLFGQQRGVAEPLEPYCRTAISFFALPSLYNEAQIVLDDFNHTTAPYGNVNSRVYEAAACGAVVMTNRTAGLGELGLGRVPVFTTATELQDLVARDLASHDAAKEAAGRADKVAVEHSYQQRAEQLDAFLCDLAEGTGGAQDGRKIIGYFPDYRDNPYLDMLWADMRSEGAVPVAIGDSLDFTALLRAADSREVVFHLNWTAPILGGGRNDAERRSRYHRFLDGLDRLQEKGVPILWTVHNMLPHECADPLLEAQLRQELADRADLIHVMVEETAEMCSGYFELPASKVRVLPHPSYIDVYPNLVDRDLARYQLGLRPDNFIYLHLGKIRPYKGVGKLLDAFDRLCQVHEDARLLVVGEPGRFEGVDEIKQRCRANPSIISSFNRVPDADLQLYLNAADVVVLPYRQILNSGALQLAYSFGKPVVAAAVGAIPQQVDDTTGVVFSWEDGEPALLNAMLTARNMGPEHARAAHQKAQQYHYLDAAKGFSRLVSEVSAE